MKKFELGLSVAVDFDGTLFTEGKFPEVGEPIYDMIWLTNYLHSKGFTIIIWTLRDDGKNKELAEEALRVMNVKYDYYNETPPSEISKWNNNPRKIGAHYFIDDRNAGGIPDIITIMSELLSIVSKETDWDVSNCHQLADMEYEFERRVNYAADMECYESMNNKNKIKHLVDKAEKAESLVEEFKAEIDELQTEIQGFRRKHPVLEENCYKIISKKDIKDDMEEVIIEMPGAPTPVIGTKKKQTFYTVCKHCGVAVDDSLKNCYRCKNPMK